MASLYTWQEPSPIKKIKLAQNAGGWWQVVIYAPEIVDGKLASLPQYLTQNGFVTYLDEVDGENVIKVADLGKHPEPLLNKLRQQGFISGAGNKSNIPDNEVKLEPNERIKKNGVRLAGATGDIGHLASIVQGFKEKDSSLILSGGLYTVSASLGAAFGNGKGAIRFSEMVSDVRDSLAREGIKLPSISIKTPEDEYRTRSGVIRAYDYVKEHSVQVLNIIGLAGNIAFAKHGFDVAKKKYGDPNNTPVKKFLILGDFLAGILAGMSALVAIFMKEKTTEERAEDEKRGGFWNKITVKPLFIQGIFNLASNAFLFPGAYEASTTKRNSKFITPIAAWTRAVAYTSSSTFTALSSKNRDKSFATKEAYEGLYAQVANMLLAVPASQQEPLIKEIAKRLCITYKSDIYVSEEEVVTGISAKLAIVKNSPWINNVINAQVAISPIQTSTATAPAERIPEEPNTQMHSVAATSLTPAIVTSRV